MIKSLLTLLLGTGLALYCLLAPRPAPQPDSFGIVELKTEPYWGRERWRRSDLTLQGCNPGMLSRIYLQIRRVNDDKVISADFLERANDQGMVQVSKDWLVPSRPGDYRYVVMASDNLGHRDVRTFGLNLPPTFGFERVSSNRVQTKPFIPATHLGLDWQPHRPSPNARSQGIDTITDYNEDPPLTPAARKIVCHGVY